MPSRGGQCFGGGSEALPKQVQCSLLLLSVQRVNKSFDVHSEFLPGYSTGRGESCRRNNTPPEGVLYVQITPKLTVWPPISFPFLQAPLSIELVDSTTVRLEHGNLTVSVSDESVGLRVLTPMAHLVDIGTEFGVKVEESGTTEVHVFEGVVVAKSTASGSVIPIAAQEAGRIDAPRDRRDLMYGEFVSVKLDRSRFRGLSTSGGGVPVDSDTHGTGQTFQRLPDGARILFLGDHATSRETHLLLINQALSNLPPEAVPRLFNAAWALPLSFNAPQYREHVASFAPTHAVLEFGPEIAGSPHPRPPEEFRQAITQLVDRLEQSGVEPIIATGFIIPRKDPHAQELLDRYNDILRELANQRGYRLADVDAISRNRPNGEPELVGTYFVPTFEGFRVMAAALLESFGCSEIPVPQSLEVSLLPGVITDWEMLPTSDRAVSNLPVQWKARRQMATGATPSVRSAVRRPASVASQRRARH